MVSVMVSHDNVEGFPGLGASPVGEPFVVKKQVLARSQGNLYFSQRLE